MRDATHDVEIERDVKITMPDGAVLLADVFHPVGLGPAPTILERTPYGRAAMGGYDPMPQMLAARGYRFVLQAVRGTDGSGGEQSFFNERADGRATADWLTTQSWWDGRLGTYGSSYMGFTQWALGVDRAVVPAGHGHRALVDALELVPRRRGRARADDQLGPRRAQLPPSRTRRVRDGHRTRRDRAEAAHAGGGVRAPPRRRRHPAGGGREPSVVRAADGPPVERRPALGAVRLRVELRRLERSRRC